jgi:hypothetical protein
MNSSKAGGKLGLLLLVYCMTWSSTLKMEAVFFSDSSGCLSTTWRWNWEDGNVQVILWLPNGLYPYNRPVCARARYVRTLCACVCVCVCVCVRERERERERETSPSVFYVVSCKLLLLHYGPYGEHFLIGRYIRFARLLKWLSSIAIEFLDVIEILILVF